MPEQITITIEFPAPKGYRRTGEVRRVHEGDWYEDFEGIARHWRGCKKSAGQYLILEPIPKPKWPEGLGGAAIAMNDMCMYHFTHMPKYDADKRIWSSPMYYILLHKWQLPELYEALKVLPPEEAIVLNPDYQESENNQ